MSNFDPTGVTSALSASQLKGLVKAAIQRSTYRSEAESAQSDIDEARNYLALYKIRAKTEVVNTAEDLSSKIEEVQFMLDGATSDEDDEV